MPGIVTCVCKPGGVALDCEAFMSGETGGGTGRRRLFVGRFEDVSRARAVFFLVLKLGPTCIELSHRQTIPERGRW